MALARLLGSHKGMTGSARFERGLMALEGLVTVDPKKMTSFEKAVLVSVLWCLIVLWLRRRWIFKGVL